MTLLRVASSPSAGRYVTAVGWMMLSSSMYLAAYSGMFRIASLKKESGDAALEWIMGIVAEPEEGKIYKGTITKIMDFGAFVRFLGTTEGLVHISEVKNERIASVSDFYKEGDTMWVKCLGTDNRGKVKLSAKRVNQETGEDLENHA